MEKALSLLNVSVFSTGPHLRPNLHNSLHGTFDRHASYVFVCEYAYIDDDQIFIAASIIPSKSNETKIRSSFAEAFTAVNQFKFFGQSLHIGHKQFDERRHEYAHNRHEPKQPADANDVNQTR